MEAPVSIRLYADGPLMPAVLYSGLALGVRVVLEGRHGPLWLRPREVVEVVVDARGFIYISDKNYGLTILRYVGPNLD